MSDGMVVPVFWVDMLWVWAMVEFVAAADAAAISTMASMFLCDGRMRFSPGRMIVLL
jgi:hypothetical protein